jgi:PAS domain S-box-containing protein
VAVLGTALLTYARLPLSATAFERLFEAALAILGVALLILLALGFARGYLLLRSRRWRARLARREREFGSVAEISAALARLTDSEEIARVVLDTMSDLLGFEFAGLVVIDDDREEARGLVARRYDTDVDWYPATRLSLREVSGVRRALETRSYFLVEDVRESEEVDRGLIDQAKLQSAIFVPLIGAHAIVGVVTAGWTSRRRSLSEDEIALTETLAAEGAIALERTRSTAALERALERERLVARISRQARSEPDVDRLIEVALAETGMALGVDRCLLRLGEPGASAPLRGEWRRDDLQPIPADATPLLAVSNTALRERRTVAIADVEQAPELDDESLGGRAILLALGTHAVLATPIIFFDRVTGVLAVHYSQPRRWREDDAAFLEAIGREFGVALHTADLLAENRRRLEQQEGLLIAAETLASELEFDSVLARLAEQAAALSAADAADCWIVEGDALRCRAVVGLPASEVGRGIVPGGAQRAAIVERRPIRERDLPGADISLGSSYESIADRIVVPIQVEDEVRGVLSVYSRQAGRFAGVGSELVDSFAEIASIALRNAEAFATRSRRARVERGFHRIAAMLGQSLSRERTIESLGQAAGETLGGSFTALLMPDGGVLTLAGSFRLPESEALAEQLSAGGEEILRLAAAERRPIVSTELATDGRFSEGWRAAASSFARSLIAAPIERQRGGEAGLVLVFFAEQRQLDDDDLELAQQLARTAVGALERSELYETERRTRALAQKLGDSRSLLSRAHDPIAVAEESARQAVDLCAADAACLFELDRGELVCRARLGDGTGELGEKRLAAAASLVAERVLRLRQPLAIEDALSQERAERFDPLLGSGHAALLAVPLSSQEDVPGGVLAVYSRRPRDWRPEEIEALVSLAGNTSAALDNASLYLRVSLESERSLAILASAADGIVAVDRAGKVVLWNAAAERITGVASTEALGRTPAEVLHHDLEEGADGQPRERTILLARGGHEIWLSVSEAIMKDPSGEIAGKIFTLRDISADRFVEQAKTDFVASVSHELRAPLTSIYGFAETLLRRNELFDEGQRRTFLAYIASESERLTEIVDTLLDVAQLDSGELEIELGSTDVTQLVNEVVDRARASQELSANGQTIQVDLPDEPLRIEADREKLSRVLFNLVDNAIRYSPSGGTITVRGRRGPETVELRVADQGAGVPEAERERIFSKFYRGESSLMGGGTGLGLFISRGLISAMGGRIWIESPEGEGSVFAIELPIGGPESRE